MDQRRLAQPVVVIDAQAELETGVAGLDVVLDVGGLLLDRGGLRVRERRSASGEVERPEDRIEVGVRRQAAGALPRTSDRGVV